MGARSERDDAERRLGRALDRVVELEAQLERSSNTERLTGLPTPDAFMRRLDPEMQRAMRHRRPLAVAALDVDGFRALNAHHGRHTGDRLLRAIAGVLGRCTRTVDVACRSGGDEFLLLLPETDEAAAVQCLDRILLELEATTVDAVPGVSASAGVACHLAGERAEHLIDRAGRALEAARRDGGGRTVALRALAPKTVAAPSEPHAAITNGLLVTLAERDRYTGEHSESVVATAVAVARGLGLDEQEQARVRTAALLHDVGKVAIPDDVLHKPGPLESAEWELMREHPVVGERILRAIPGLGGVARIVRHEHESWDGTGYPDGLRGEEIPIGSRIILACDAYDAMTTDRPYRRAMSHAEAIRELYAWAGRRFDPRVTEAVIGQLYGSRRSMPREAPAVWTPEQPTAGPALRVA